MDRLLLSQRWLSGTRADIRELVVADADVVGDYKAFPSSNILNGSAVTATTQKDLEADTTAANIVRSDLGLPPVGGAEAIGWSLFGLWSVTGRWELAVITVIAAAVGVAVFFGARRLSRREVQLKREHKSKRNALLLGTASLILAILLLVDIVLVVEGIAHIIWPNFVDTGA